MRKWPSCLLLLDVHSGTYRDTHQEVFLDKIVVSTLRYQSVCPIGQGTEIHGEEEPVLGMLVPRPVLWLNVLEETQDPFIGPVIG